MEIMVWLGTESLKVNRKCGKSHVCTWADMAGLGFDSPPAGMFEIFRS